MRFYLSINNVFLSVEANNECGWGAAVIRGYPYNRHKMIPGLLIKHIKGFPRQPPIKGIIYIMLNRGPLNISIFQYAF